MGLNSEMFPDYHKLDINFNYSFKLFNSTFETYINLYNVYNRHNVFAQYAYLKENEEGEMIPVIKRISLFPFIPSIGISIKY